jgi:hypothetical protein
MAAMQEKSIRDGFGKIKNPAMDVKTIVLLGSESLLGHSVEFLLSTEKTWQIDRISGHQNFNKLLQDVKKASPSIVILCQTFGGNNARLLTSLLKDHPGLKVITINPRNNLLEIYSKKRVWIKDASDFISIVEG